MIKGQISVIMSVYNNADTLEEALDSIINQTYTNWKMIVCDDGSIDNSYEIIQEYVDKYPDKFVLIRNEKNLGLNQSLNNCLEFAEGEYIARMDGDDISYPERFAEEIKVLENNSDISIVSTEMDLFDKNGMWGKTSAKKYPQKNDFLKGSTPFSHAPCMVRKEAYDAVDGYTVDKRLLRVEDFHLWVKMYAKGYVGTNIQKPLYKMRDDQNAQKRRKFKYRLNAVYVRAFAVKQFKFPVYMYVYCLRPIIIGLLPRFLYNSIHRMNFNKK